MRKITYFSLLVLLISAGLACNKEVDSVPIPPFSVYPNPFTDQFTAYLDNTFPTSGEATFRILDGKNNPITVWEDPAPGSAFFVDMTGREQAIYYAELTVGRQVFLTPIIKAE